MNAPLPAQAMLSEDAARRFEGEIAKYPPEQKASAVIACLAILQKEHGYISQESEVLVAVVPRTRTGETSAGPGLPRSADPAGRHLRLFAYEAAPPQRSTRSQPRRELWLPSSWSSRER